MEGKLEEIQKKRKKHKFQNADLQTKSKLHQQPDKFTPLKKKFTRTV
jgi:hypothetical protein